MCMSIGHLAWSLLFFDKTRNNDAELLRSECRAAFDQGGSERILHLR